MRRRQVLAAGAGGIALLSGCSAPNDTESGSGNRDISQPQITGLDEQKWTVKDDRQNIHEKSFSVVKLTGYERTLIYENEQLRERLHDWTLGNFDSTVMMFFATRIEFEGLVSSAVRVPNIEDLALPNFKNTMNEQGLSDVGQTSVSEPSPNLSVQSKNYEYGASYTVDGFSREMDIDGVGTRMIEFPDSILDVTAVLSIWVDGSTGYVAGGVFPAEKHFMSDSTSVSGGEVGQGIDTTVDITLGLQPDKYRNEVVDMIENVS